MFLKLARKGPCRKYIARLEESIQTSGVEVLESAAGLDLASAKNLDPMLARHLEGCARCREALRAAQLTRALLRETYPAQPDPGPLFASRVVAEIRAEEKELHSEFEFWKPIEDFAGRFAWASSVVLLVLSSAVYQMRSSRGSSFAAPETLSDRYPDLVPDQPSSKDEVLISLAEKSHE